MSASVGGRVVGFMNTRSVPSRAAPDPVLRGRVRPDRVLDEPRPGGLSRAIWRLPARGDGRPGGWQGGSRGRQDAVPPALDTAPLIRPSSTGRRPIVYWGRACALSDAESARCTSPSKAAARQASGAHSARRTSPANALLFMRIWSPERGSSTSPRTVAERARSPSSATARPSAEVMFKACRLGDRPSPSSTSYTSGGDRRRRLRLRPRLRRDAIACAGAGARVAAARISSSWIDPRAAAPAGGRSRPALQHAEIVFGEERGSMAQTARTALRVGIGGPVGAGKTALMDQLCKRMRDALVDRRDHQRHLHPRGRRVPDALPGAAARAHRRRRDRRLPAHRDPRGRLDQPRRRRRAGAPLPRPRLILIESGGDNLSATFSPELADLTLYVIDVCRRRQDPAQGRPRRHPLRPAHHQQDRPRAARRRRRSR